jgi:hypothetical protein
MILNIKEKKIMAKFSENSITVFNYVKENEGEDLTAQDIADGTGLAVKSVNGIVTAAFQRKDIMERIPAEIELADGTHKPVKIIKLTKKGKAITDIATYEE